MRTLIALLVSAPLLCAQGRGAAAAQTPAASDAATRAAFIRENYTKFEYRIAMRDGAKLFTSVYIPRTRLPTTAPTQS
ncbi:MAG: hypothetical protein WDO73_16955 [Ignavibacteriota bacterium]